MRCPVPLHFVGRRGLRPPFWGAKPPHQAIYLGVDRLGPWWTGPLMEKTAYTRINVSDVRVIMAIMCVPVGELLCEVVT
jgi:hypothetical protein